MTSKNVSKNLKKLSDKDKKISRFSDILDSLDSLEDKKKLLWKDWNNIRNGKGLYGSRNWKFE